MAAKDDGKSGGNTHEGCCPDAQRVEKRLMDFERILKELRDQNNRIQRYNFQLVQELNESKEHERMIEQFLFAMI